MIKKYNKEMRFITSKAIAHSTIVELKNELETVKHTVDYWFGMFKNRAFGEIKDGNLSYAEWRDIYIKNGWLEVPEYRCFCNPKGVTNSDDWAAYELDKSYLNIWKKWYQYHERWKFRIAKLESERFDIRRIEELTDTTINECLLAILGLSPSIIGKTGFEKFSFGERLFEIKDIKYQDYKGNNLTINTRIYANNGFGHIEWRLRQKEEYVLLERLATRGQPSNFSDFIRSEKFLKWAYEYGYLMERVFKIRNISDSPWGEDFALKLYQELINIGYIKGKFEYMWEREDGMSESSLHYLANELLNADLIPSKHHFTSIEKYIEYSSPKPLRKQYNENTETTNFAGKNPFSAESDLIDKAITKLELDRDNKLKEK
jgi:hypothetical protein